MGVIKKTTKKQFEYMYNIFCKNIMNAKASILVVFLKVLHTNFRTIDGKQFYMADPSNLDRLNFYGHQIVLV